MCTYLKISRQMYYNLKDKKDAELKKDPYNDIFVEVFVKNQRVYGTRKIKVERKNQICGLQTQDRPYHAGKRPGFCLYN